MRAEHGMTQWTSESGSKSEIPDRIIEKGRAGEHNVSITLKPVSDN